MTHASSAAMAGNATEVLLATGDVEVLGRLPYSSNYTFLARVTGPSSERLAVYKPRQGETPLWDFRQGTLAARELAAFRVSEAAGWGIVPPTVLRSDAPLGEGSLQVFIEHDPDRHYFALMEERREEFARFAAFDVVVNNADRKAGHVLEDGSGRLWGVDHGVTFHVEPKLRTVIWAFAGESLGDQ
ncbi:MAG: SCO1664 family protein, partial [Actinomycetota bacterium]